MKQNPDLITVQVKHQVKAKEQVQELLQKVFSAALNKKGKLFLLHHQPQLMLKAHPEVCRIKEDPRNMLTKGTCLTWVAAKMNGSSNRNKDATPEVKEN